MSYHTNIIYVISHQQGTISYHTNRALYHHTRKRRHFILQFLNIYTVLTLLWVCVISKGRCCCWVSLILNYCFTPGEKKLLYKEWKNRVYKYNIIQHTIHISSMYGKTSPFLCFRCWKGYFLEWKIPNLPVFCHTGIGFNLQHFGMDLFPIIFVNFKTPCLHGNSS